MRYFNWNLYIYIYILTNNIHYKVCVVLWYGESSLYSNVYDIRRFGSLPVEFSISHILRAQNKVSDLFDLVLVEDPPPLVS